MKIGIIGAGMIGGTLTKRLSELGHEVSVANSRGPDSLQTSQHRPGRRRRPSRTPPAARTW